MALMTNQLDYEEQIMRVDAGFWDPGLGEGGEKASTLGYRHHDGVNNEEAKNRIKILVVKGLFGLCTDDAVAALMNYCNGGSVLTRERNLFSELRRFNKNHHRVAELMEIYRKESIRRKKLFRSCTPTPSRIVRKMPIRGTRTCG